MSEVEVSPSTVTALNVSPTAADSARCSAGAEIGASVKRKANIVAMSGAIMPAPLAMPATVTVSPPMRAVADRALGNVSVVMIARAASRSWPGLAWATSSPTARSNFDGSSGSPITPVEAR